MGTDVLLINQLHKLLKQCNPSVPFYTACTTVHARLARLLRAEPEFERVNMHSFRQYTFQATFKLIIHFCFMLLYVVVAAVRRDAFHLKIHLEFIIWRNLQPYLRYIEALLVPLIAVYNYRLNVVTW